MVAGRVVVGIGINIFFVSHIVIFLRNSGILDIVSFFLNKKITQVNLEKSSTITRVYFLPLKLRGDTGPKRSICNNSKILSEEELCKDLKEALVCFPF